GPVCEMVADLLVYFARFHRRQYGFDGVPIHDACAVAVALRPELVTTRHLHVDVETRGELTTGRTVVDLWGVTGNPPTPTWPSTSTRTRSSPCCTRRSAA